MEEISNPLIGKAIIKVARNSPVALVIGAAGFLGSHLSDKLLEHNIQVIGVDNFKSGKKENVEQAVKDSHFHLLNHSAERLNLEVDHLDYIFILAGEHYNLEPVLKLAKEHKSKTIFISWIDLYDHKSSLSWFKKTESDLAQSAKEHKLNARVLRLATTFGPRMNFKDSDPMTNLIAASLTDKLQEESTTLEFSTRALFISDAVSLIMKSMLSGSTAWKIFDGANPSPVKITEVKQILLDPIWHENRGFKPTELPPWPTPNLERTQKELHWSPKKDLVEGLRQTLEYFKKHDFKISEPAPIKGEVVETAEEDEEEKIGERKEEKTKRKIKFPKLPLGKILIFALFFYGFIYPIMTASIGLAFLNLKATSIVDNYQKGELDQALIDIGKTKSATKQVKEAVSPFLIIGNVVLNNQTREAADKLMAYEEGLKGGESLIHGTKNLKLAFKAISGEKPESPKEYLKQAEAEFTAAESLLVPVSLKVEDLTIKELANFAVINKQVAATLPSIIESDKHYLIYLQDNGELTASGGKMVALARVSFKDDKLKEVKIVEPIKEGSEADFRVSARQVISNFNIADKTSIDGVMTLDLVTAQRLSEGFQIEDFPELLNKTLFLFDTNLSEDLVIFNKDASEKHLQYYFLDPKLTYLNPNEWSSGEDFLSIVESNTGGNKANLFLDRSISLEVTDKGMHKLGITYTNRGQIDTSGSDYKARLRIFVSYGSKLTNVRLGNEDVTSKVTTSADFGKTTYALDLAVKAREAIGLNMTYETSPFKEILIVKQPGTGPDPLFLKLPKGNQTLHLKTNLKVPLNP